MSRVMYNRHIHLIMRGIVSRHCIKCLSTSSSVMSANYYDTLGIAQRSTQTEIKTAYYKLSMQYHPDKNKGCDKAAIKFREITQAYEVLGNYRLRRLYDKGIIHTAGPQYAQKTSDEEPEVEDDAETKFYKSRFTRSKVKTEDGRTPIYDFDEWSRAHYGAAFQRRQDAKAKYDRKQALRKQHEYDLQLEIFLFGLVFIGLGMLSIFYTESELDTPRERAAAKMKESAESSTTSLNTSTTSSTTSTKR